MSRRIPALVCALLTLFALGFGKTALEGPALWLQRYLQIDTTNPPGNEEQAAHFLGRILHQEGIATQLIFGPHGRPSLYARLEADKPTEGALVLLHHMDVVPPGEGWSGDPFSGEIKNRLVWGRGAIDDKSLGVAHLTAFVELNRRRIPLERDVIFLAVPDEETGGTLGTGWLLEEHPELFSDVEVVLGEGGINRAFNGKHHWWGIEVAQKRPLWLKVTAYGRAGHGSKLNLHTAPHRLIRGLSRLVDKPLEFRVTPETRQYLEAAAAFEGPFFKDLVARLDEIMAEPQPEKQLLPGLPNYFLDTIQVNVLEAGEKLNVAPEEASALIDIRLLPDTDDQEFLAKVQELLGKDLEVEVVLRAPPVSGSPTDSPFYRCMERFLGRRAAVIPAFIPGITDSRYFRERGIAAYGFSPFVLESNEVRGIHGPDERIPLETFEKGVETTTELVVTCSGRD
ncbi:MAG: M20/M25/M40 family metallo-hydrolase [Thermoanaerobaculia bacterium]